MTKYYNFLENSDGNDELVMMGRRFVYDNAEGKYYEPSSDRYIEDDELYTLRADDKKSQEQYKEIIELGIDLAEDPKQIEKLINSKHLYYDQKIAREAKAEALKLLKDDLEVRDVPDVLYHATYSPALPSINTFGLGSANADKVFAWDNNKKQNDHVFLHEDKNSAESYAEISENVPDEWLDQIVVLKVDTSMLDQSFFARDPYLIDSYGSYIYYGIIPKEAISQI